MTKTLRAGSARKREAILVAARQLWLSDGFDRASVDAIAARAGVSKRTLYDYFGDKQALLHAVLDDVSETLLTTIRRTLDETLGGVSDAAALEDALTAFAVRIAAETLGSADYASLQRMAHGLAEIDELAMADAPEEALALQLAKLGEAGLLDVPDPRLAADHFIGLTFLVVANRMGSVTVSRQNEACPLLAAGVQAFLRAYRPSA